MRSVSWYVEAVKVWIRSAWTGIWLIWIYLTNKHKFNSKRRQEVKEDERDVRGKIIIVTGSNSGIGKQTAKELAAHGATLIMACRDPQKAVEARQEILQQVPKADLVLMRVDMGDLESIRAFAKEFKERYDHLDVLVNNAGILTLRRTTTKDGFEGQMGTNYLGPFLLTLLLLDWLLKADEARIVNLSSSTCVMADLRLDNLMMRGQPQGLWTGYANSKLAIAMFSKRLSKLLADTNVNTYAVCTGFVNTNLIREEPPTELYRHIRSFIEKTMQFTVEEGTENVLHCILSKSLSSESGKFYTFLNTWDEPDKVMSRYYSSNFWYLSEDLVGLKGYTTKFLSCNL